jgi:hypothetical protein
MLDDLHNHPAVQLHRSTMNSCGEPFIIESDKFGPFRGQMLVPDENARRITRVMLEKIDGAWQGASTLFLNTKELRAGGVRIAMNTSGETIYYASTTRGWQSPDEGLQRITFNGKTPFHIKTFNLTTQGFRFDFTLPIAKPEKLLEKISVNSFCYEYGYRYGSSEKDKKEHKVLGLTGKGPFKIKIDQLLPGRIYQIEFDDQLRSTSGASMDDLNAPAKVYYTLNRLKRPSSNHPATLTQTKDKIEVKIGGGSFATYHFNRLAQPIVWPIQGPGDIRMLRDYPLKEGTAGEAKDHPHHRAMFIGQQGMNGANFWHNQNKNAGTVEHLKVIETRSGEDRALLKTLNAWKDHLGKLSEQTLVHSPSAETKPPMYSTWSSTCMRPMRISSLRNSRTALSVSEPTPIYASRPIPNMALKKFTARPATVRKEKGKGIWGKRADWVHYYGTIEGKQAGIAFMSHPSNLTRKGEKSWWHARDYGLISANPFAPEKIGGDGEYRLPRGQSLKLRYRFVFHRGPAKDAKIGERFSAFAMDPGHPHRLCPTTRDTLKIIFPKRKSKV